MPSKKPDKKTPSKKPAANAAILPPAPLIPAGEDLPALPASIENMQQPIRKTFTNVAAATDWLRKQLPLNDELTPLQRRRLNGAGPRKYGFIVKTWETAEARPAFRPPGFSVDDLGTSIANVEEARQLLALIDQLRRLVDDFLLVSADDAYRGSLRFYRNLRELARSRNPGAQALFDQLRRFFTLRRRNLNEPEPTEHQIERDIRSLLHGHADGEMIIKNESPHTTGGVHEVVDEVQKRGKRKAEIKIKEEE